jgi:hypothetical protein
MTTEETKSDGPAVLSSAVLGAFDAFAQSLVTHPHRMTPEMWPKGWLFFEAGWRAAILAEREARYSAECADMIRARSNAEICAHRCDGLPGYRAGTNEGEK